MGKAIGIGGIFMKYKDEAAMKTWFETALGLTPNDYGVLFAFNGVADSKRGFLQLGTFANTTKYFGNPAQQYMINFRVTDLVGLEAHLRELGTVICDSIETYEYGSFLHIEDPEGNRIELWEPAEEEFESTEVFVDMR
ncbi:MAG: glyoxalase [Candidatus Fluviicola riflensis]|nr:MAG: glyoxalase [Candidatus Fluviicola riflensis]OGS79101.1 MAG: glyoxalase [Candidatus Fluviicola riflensis]OGS86123.1 MAG: glyoxalase [Fluviicola sp. RIFCSPHIGHO2_12_FULL_43_24]OGS86533.1 MAG: glyoxalase [Fluviicola sp. RIFCSPHIGHO2_01_FULL_43_53]